jgi:hypothetical protein
MFYLAFALLRRGEQPELSLSLAKQVASLKIQISKYRILYGKILFNQKQFEEASQEFIEAETLIRAKNEDRS